MTALARDEMLLNRASLQDLRSAQIVQVERDNTGKLWVNVDGKCLLRIGQVDSLDVEDKHKER